MRRSVLVAAAVTLASIPATADAKKEEKCFGRKADVISTKNDDQVRLNFGHFVAIIKGNRTKVTGHPGGVDGDPPPPGFPGGTGERCHLREG